MSKKTKQKPKTTAKLSKTNQSKRRSNNVIMVSSVKSTVILLPFLTFAQLESGTRKTKFWSMTVYN